MGRYKKHDAKTETITIRITEEIKSKILDIKAKKRLTTISQVIRLLILKEI
jgi:antitoxin component of RelBE/YafQ-DinJ toxin-antitoxin module